MTVRILLLAVFVLYILFIAVPAVILFFTVCSRRDGKKNRKSRLEDSVYLPYEQQMKAGLVYLRRCEHREMTEHAFDGISLAADYYPAGSKTTAILMHGYSSFPVANFCVIGTELHKMGMNVLMPYEIAHLKSGGKHSTLSMLEQYDVLTWIDRAEREGAEQIVLYGISMGASSVACALDKIKTKSVKRAVIDCGFVSPYEAMQKEAVKRKLPFRLMIPFSILLARALFHADLRKAATQSLSGTAVPALFLYGDADETVGTESGKRLFESCASQKQYIEVRGAKHTVAYLAATPEQKESIDRFLNICRDVG